MRFGVTFLLLNCTNILGLTLIDKKDSFIMAYISGATSLLANYTNVRSRVECAGLCVAASCEAFHMNPNEKRCILYSSAVTSDRNDNSSDTIYIRRINNVDESTTQVQETTVPDIKCPTENGFTLLVQAGETFCFRIELVAVNFNSAHSSCFSLDARLVHFDSLAKYEAIATLRSQLGLYHSQKTWVGATDLRSEGTWVAELNLQPLDPAFWLWQTDEPNDKDGNEDCALVDGSIRLNDERCFLSYYPLCEIAV